MSLRVIRIETIGNIPDVREPTKIIVDELPKEYVRAKAVFDSNVILSIRDEHLAAVMKELERYKNIIRRVQIDNKPSDSDEIRKYIKRFKNDKR